MTSSSLPNRDADFRALVDEHKERIYHLALDLTGNHHDAEDLSQDVFVKAYHALDDFRGDAKLSTWLYRITVNTHLNEERKRTAEVTSLHEDDGATAPSGSASGLPSPDQRVKDQRLQKQLDDALDALSPRERTAFVLRHYQDLSTKEAAKAMDIAPGTVKSLLYRALRKLRSELRQRRDDLSEHSE